MWQLEKSINLLRIPGDIALAASFPILWLRLYLFGPRGVSVETQILHLITFVARYAYPGSFSLSCYNSFMKGWLLGASLISVILLFFLLRQNVCSTIISRPFSSPIIAIALPALILSLFIHYPPSSPVSVSQRTIINISWAFSQYLSVGAMIPQLGMMVRLAGYSEGWDATTGSNAVTMADYDSMSIQKSDVEDVASMKIRRESYDASHSSSDEEDDEESKALLLPYFPPTIPVNDSNSNPSGDGVDDDIESQRPRSRFPSPCSSLAPSTSFHDSYPFKPSFPSPCTTSSSWLASTWLNVDTLLWAYLASVSLFRIFYIHHWTWRYHIRGTHDPISLASACTQLVVCGAGVFAIWLSCASTYAYEWRMKGTGRGWGEVGDRENEREGEEDGNPCQVGVGASLGVPRIEVTNVDEGRGTVVSTAASHPRPPRRSPSGGSMSGRRKSMKGKGRKRGGKRGRRSVSVELGTLDTILETPELEGELVEAGEAESLGLVQAQKRGEEDGRNLKKDGFVPLPLLPPSPSRSLNESRSQTRPMNVSQPNLLHPLWARTSV